MIDEWQCEGWRGDERHQKPFPKNPGARAPGAKLKKPQIAEMAARLSKDRRHLPEPLASWTKFSPSPEHSGAKDERSLAQAMCEAIEQDESRDASSTAPASNREKVASFIDSLTRSKRLAKGFDLRAKASQLGAAYDEYAVAQGWPALSPFHLAKALSDCGFEKARLKNGVHYLGLGLLDAMEGA
jgi:hypothetical protein